MDHRVRILSWNVNKQRKCLQQALRARFDMIGIQEHSAPGKNPSSGSQAGYELYVSGRVAVYVTRAYLMQCVQ